MEARIIRAAILAASVLALGASYRTQNFLVTAPTPDFAQRVGAAAEDFRRTLAVEWLGEELPAWGEPCPITVHVGPQLGAGGATSFMFMGGRPTGWTMTIQGSAERVLDSVLPHEITHTIFATHFGRPLPRWADEGACTVVEDISEREKQHRLLYQFLSSGRGIAFNQMFAMKEYPPDVLPLYSQGYSLVRFLLAQGGKQKFVQYVGDGMKWNNWTKATQQHYGFKSLSDLQVTWVDWVRRGSPASISSEPQTAIQLAAATGSVPRAGNAVDASQEWRSAGADSSSQQSAVAPSAKDAKSEGTAVAAATNPIRLASTSTSWYARVRDENRSKDFGSPPKAQPARSLHQAIGQALSAQPSAPRDTEPRVVTRPQPLQQAEQRVIEWSQPHKPSAPQSQAAGR